MFDTVSLVPEEKLENGTFLQTTSLKKQVACILEGMAAAAAIYILNVQD